MTFYLIRHGRTDWNDLNHIQGKSDIPLNDVGISQAKDLAKRLKSDKLPITRIYTSPLKRAVQTADILGEALNIPCDTMDELREVDLGDWEGISWKDVAAKYPDIYNKWRANRRYTKVPGGESYDDMFVRTVSSLRKLAATHTEDDVAIVTHSAVIMAILCSLNGDPFERMPDYKVTNTSVTSIDSSELFELT